MPELANGFVAKYGAELKVCYPIGTARPLPEPACAQWFDARS